MRRTLLGLTLCALPTAAAIALLASRRTARDREEKALNEVARLQLRIVEMTADYDVACGVVRKCHAERDRFGVAANAAENRANNAMAARGTALVRADAAEKARDEAELRRADAIIGELRARIAELEQTATIDPAAVAPVAKNPCPACSAEIKSCLHWSRLPDGEIRELCPDCYEHKTDAEVAAAIRARHAARTASATPVAAVAKEGKDIRIENGRQYRRIMGLDEGPWTVTLKLRSGRIQLGNGEMCTTATEQELSDAEAWRLVEREPTQDDLDDAAVRSLLERGPATWFELHALIDEPFGAPRLFAALGRVEHVENIRTGCYHLPAASDPAKDPS